MLVRHWGSCLISHKNAFALPRVPACGGSRCCRVGFLQATSFSLWLSQHGSLCDDVTALVTAGTGIPGARPLLKVFHSPNSPSRVPLRSIPSSLLGASVWDEGGEMGWEDEEGGWGSAGAAGLAPRFGAKP